MSADPSYYKHHIFFCLNKRENGEAHRESLRGEGRMTRIVLPAHPERERSRGKGRGNGLSRTAVNSARPAPARRCAEIARFAFRA